MQTLLKHDEQTAERKIETARVMLMRSAKFRSLGGVMMMGKVTVKDTCPTAYTNGRDEVYGRDFILKLERKGVAFTVAHETLHKALMHLTTYRSMWKEDPQLANEACDYAINNILVKTDPDETVIAMPRDEHGRIICLYDPCFDNMSEKQIFDILKKEKQEGKRKSSGSFDEHGWEDASSMSEEEQKQLGEDIERAMRQGLMAGDGAGNLDRVFGELLAPKVDWREVLREFVQSVCAGLDDSSWTRVNKRYIGNDVYFPSMISEQVGEIVVGGDMSGSCTRYITPFLSEFKAIADEVKPERLHLLYWDHVVAGHEEYDASNMDSLVQSTKPRGGGGTDPRSVMNYINNRNINPQCIVILTDGEVNGNWGNDWNAPVLWVVVGNRKIVAPVGTTIHMEE
jgi:predicted metal-dependent peptidase